MDAPKIKIGRNEIAIKNGDYIIFNGAVWMLCSGDRRALRKERGFTKYNYITISHKVAKSLIKEFGLKETIKKMPYDIERPHYFFNIEKNDE